MRLVKWSPFMDLEEWGDYYPAIDVYQKDDKVIVETPLPNIDAEKLAITVENNVLTIEGQSEKKSEVDDQEYYRKEVRYGSFQRAVALPAAVQGDKALAEYQDGILKITIPKAAEAQKKSIKVIKK